MKKKIALALCVVVLCAASFAGGYARGKYHEAHQPIYGFDIQYWDANGQLHPTGYKAIASDRPTRLIIAGIPRK